MMSTIKLKISRTAGRGQRIGLFAGTGVGKSVLLGMIARYTDADVTVLAPRPTETK